MSPDQSVFIGSALAVFIYFFCNRDFLWSRCTLVHAHNEMISNADNKREREKKRSRVLRATDSILCMYNSFIECLRIIWQISIRLTLRHSDAQNEETNNNYKKKKNKKLCIGEQWAQKYVCKRCPHAPLTQLTCSNWKECWAHTMQCKSTISHFAESLQQRSK